MTLIHKWPKIFSMYIGTGPGGEDKVQDIEMVDDGWGTCECVKVIRVVFLKVCVASQDLCL